MAPKKNEPSDDYRDRLRKYLNNANALKQSDLANYASHRRVIIDFLDSAIQGCIAGNYENEQLIQALLMPMRANSQDLALDSCNLWLIDERLAFHDYLASAKPLKVTPLNSMSKEELSDFYPFNICDNPLLVSEGSSPELSSLVVVEIKSPMKNNVFSGAETDSLKGALDYLDKIRKGEVCTPTGRPISASAHIPSYCYIVCDLNARMQEICRSMHLTLANDGMAYFGFDQSLQVYLEVISFERLVLMAKQRNRAVFDKWGSP